MEDSTNAATVDVFRARKHHRSSHAKSNNLQFTCIKPLTPAPALQHHSTPTSCRRLASLVLHLHSPQRLQSRPVLGFCKCFVPRFLPNRVPDLRYSARWSGTRPHLSQASLIFHSVFAVLLPTRMTGRRLPSSVSTNLYTSSPHSDPSDASADGLRHCMRGLVHERWLASTVFHMEWC